MQINLLCEYASSIVGAPAEGVVKELHGKKKVNEFLISKKLNLTINQTRNILYRLADEGLVNFIRKKDNKKGGWYIYFWSLEIGKGLQKMHELLMEKISKLKERFEIRMMQRFYFCPSYVIEVSEENALLNDYHCSECGQLLDIKEPKEELEQLKKELQALEKQLDDVAEEVEEWDSKEGKRRMRKARDEDKKKEAERAKKRKERKAEKNRMLKKTAKKSKTKKKLKQNKKTAKKSKTKKKLKQNKKTAKKISKKKISKKQWLAKNKAGSFIKRLLSSRKK